MRTVDCEIKLACGPCGRGNLLHETSLRPATIMFTDFEDSTGLAQELGTYAIALYLKSHFAMAESVVEAHGGTLVCTTGDGVLAYWSSASGSATDDARSAMTAALDLAEMVDSDNRRRILGNLPARRLRVGLHSGKVLIDPPSRKNAAPRIFGSAVHEARRVEQTGKTIPSSGTDTIIVTSCLTMRLSMRNQPKEATPAISDDIRQLWSGRVVLCRS